MVFKGFKFGMLLQIAVGPICLFIFQTSTGLGFLSGMTGVLGVTIIDGLFILAAILGIGTLLNKYTNIKKPIQYFGAAVLIVFGFSNIVGVVGISIIPSMEFLTEQSMNTVFLKTLMLTLSNPLTILFWAGVFSAKIVEDRMNKFDMYLFGLGALLSTFLFLTLISALGHYAYVFLSSSILDYLNIIVGIILIIFGLKTALKKL